VTLWSSIAAGATRARSKLLRVPLKVQTKLRPPTWNRMVSPPVMLTNFVSGEIAIVRAGIDPAPGAP